MALDLDFFRSAGSAIRNIGSGVVDFFRSPKMDTARDIFDGVRTIGTAFRDATSDVSKEGPVGLADPNVNLGQFKVRGTSRSQAGVPSFGDIGEASFYKYAQLQNTVRYLYNQKARYQSIAKDKR
jgi:hypothetical protein|tara:strand:- start:33 stop:407 length:375 start_codon:yes stop_codon:yes gene_type:complete